MPFTISTLPSLVGRSTFISTNSSTSLWILAFPFSINVLATLEFHRRFLADVAAGTDCSTSLSSLHQSIQMTGKVMDNTAICGLRLEPETPVATDKAVAKRGLFLVGWLFNEVLGVALMVEGSADWSYSQCHLMSWSLPCQWVQAWSISAG